MRVTNVMQEMRVMQVIQVMQGMQVIQVIKVTKVMPLNASLLTSYVNQLMQPMQAHLSVNFRNKNCEHKCSGVRFFLGQILKCSPVVSSYFQCL